MYTTFLIFKLVFKLSIFRSKNKTFHSRKNIDAARLGTFTFMHLADAFIQCDLQCSLLMQLTLSETWVSGNLTAPTERSQRAIRWRVGEVANRVSCGSFRGGH